ncbi:MAG: hypothetical protein ACRELX_12410 [Longimicrobiales bacterium]
MIRRGVRLPALRNIYAPITGDAIAVCPHCWGVNTPAGRLCGRCGADMHLMLQESGGLRSTAPVQSPVPIRARGRLTRLQRALVLCFVLLLAIAHIVGALYMGSRRGGAALIRASTLPLGVDAAGTRP